MSVLIWNELPSTPSEDVHSVIPITGVYCIWYVCSDVILGMWVPHRYVGPMYGTWLFWKPFYDCVHSFTGVDTVRVANVLASFPPAERFVTISYTSDATRRTDTIQKKKEGNVGRVGTERRYGDNRDHTPMTPAESEKERRTNRTAKRGWQSKLKFSAPKHSHMF